MHQMLEVDINISTDIDVSLVGEQHMKFSIGAWGVNGTGRSDMVLLSLDHGIG